MIFVYNIFTIFKIPNTSFYLSFESIFIFASSHYKLHLFMLAHTIKPCYNSTMWWESKLENHMLVYLTFFFQPNY